MQPYNRLSPAELERLACLAEEAAEVIKEVGKIIRHGYVDREPGGLVHDNRAALATECGDFLDTLNRMIAAGDVGDDVVNEARLAKHVKLAAFTRYQPDSLTVAEGGIA